MSESGNGPGPVKKSEKSRNHKEKNQASSEMRDLHIPATRENL